MSETAQSILKFWFEDSGPKAWFTVDPDFDETIRTRFSSLLRSISLKDDITSHPWLDSPDSALALVILLDQFPRNIWRDEAGAFAYDGLALSATRDAIRRGHDEAIDPKRQSFFYMPFMHCEQLDVQNEGVDLCVEKLGESDGTTKHARSHRDVIERFGRFPHRNGILEREPSLEEISYLAGGGYAPGAKGSAKSS